MKVLHLSNSATPLRREKKLFLTSGYDSAQQLLILIWRICTRYRCNMIHPFIFVSIDWACRCIIPFLSSFTCELAKRNASLLISLLFLSTNIFLSNYHSEVVSLKKISLKDLNEKYQAPSILECGFEIFRRHSTISTTSLATKNLCLVLS